MSVGSALLHLCRRTCANRGGAERKNAFTRISSNYICFHRRFTEIPTNSLVESNDTTANSIDAATAILAAQNKQTNKPTAKQTQRKINYHA